MILCIDTALDKCSVALCWEDDCIDIVVNEDAFKASEVLHNLIQKILHKNNLELKDLKAVAVNGGPGSYTGLRIGATSAKGLCYALNIPLIHIDGLRLMTQAVLEQLDNQFDYYVPMIDARRMEVFTCIFDKHMNLLLNSQPVILTENFLDNYVDGKIAVFGNCTQKASSILSSESITFLNDIYFNASCFKTLVWDKWLKADFQNNNTYAPNYLKKFYSTH